MSAQHIPGRRGPVAAFVAGLALVATAVVAHAGGVPVPTDVGQVPGTVARPVQVGPAGHSAAAPTGRSRESADARPISTTAPRPSSAGAPAAVSRPAVTRPDTVYLPSLGVSAAVRPVRAVDGILQVPEDPGQLGWWTGGAGLGSSQGTIVIDGHIDSATRGIGALFRLGALGPGDEVRIRAATGPTVEYTVQARRVYPKAAGLPAEVFSRDGPPRLVLISCGGTFDERARSYDDNIVVYATPDR